MVIVRALLDDDRKIRQHSAPIPVRALIAISQPVLWVILALAFLWLTLRPSRRWIVRSFQHRNVATRSIRVALWRAAGGILAQAPCLVLAMLLIGAAIGLLLGQVPGVIWGVAAAVLGGSLAPVIFELAGVSDERP